MYRGARHAPRWGSRGRRFKSGQPDGASPRDLSPDPGGCVMSGHVRSWTNDSLVVCAPAPEGHTSLALSAAGAAMPRAPGGERHGRDRIARDRIVRCGGSDLRARLAPRPLVLNAGLDVTEPALPADRPCESAEDMQKTAIILVPTALLLGLGLAACSSDSNTDTGTTTNTVAPGSTMSPSFAPSTGVSSMAPTTGMSSSALPSGSSS